MHQLVDTVNAVGHAGRVDHPTAVLKKDAEGNYVNPNDHSIGIETSMVLTDQPAPPQHDALVGLIAQLCQQFSIPMDRGHVVGHHEIYSLKTCPGTIDVDSLVPTGGVAQEAALVGEVSAMVPEVDALPEPQRVTYQGLLDRLLSRIASIFSRL